MIATTLAVLFSVVAIATILALVDFWLRANSAYASLKRHSALSRAGFVPQMEAQFVNLRPVNAMRASGSTRLYATRLPHHRRASARVLDAA